MQDTSQIKKHINERLRELTQQSQILLTNSGNSAIFLALIAAKQRGIDTIFIPDQGGWFTYKTFPPVLGLDIKELKTDYGLIDLKELEQNANPHSGLIFASLAGYIAPQPLKQISEICSKKGCLLIEDASGVIGDPVYKELCNGKYSDIIVASFGKWKSVNLGYGGFISSNTKENLRFDKGLLQMFRFHESFYEALYQKLDLAKARTAYFHSMCDKIIKELSNFKIIHSDKPGLNVVVKSKTLQEKEKIINYCRNNQYEYTTCPRYIRVMENAISIEVKRLDMKG
jgi:hypothetical protein